MYPLDDDSLDQTGVLPTIVTVVFGAGENVVAFMENFGLPALPNVGAPVTLNLSDPADPNPFVVSGVVYDTTEDITDIEFDPDDADDADTYDTDAIDLAALIGENDEFDTYGLGWPDEDDDDDDGFIHAHQIASVLVYGGLDVPTPEQEELLYETGWIPVDSELTGTLAGLISEIPPIAVVHESVLAVGDPDNHNSITMYATTGMPDDPSVPLFGERARLPLTDGPLDDDYDDFSDDMTDEEYRDAWIAREDKLMEAIDREIATETPRNIRTEGFPVITLGSWMVEPGLARVLYWTPTLGDVTPQDLLDAQWEIQTIPDAVDPTASDFATMVRLAKRTRLRFEPSIMTYLRPRDWTITNADTLTDTELTYLPSELVDHVLTGREMESLDTIIDSWANELKPNT